MKLPLTYYGNPILRAKAKQVTAITDEIRAFVNDMLDTMRESSGLGIAAPQVGKSLAIFITAPPIEEEGNEFKQAPPQVFINPKLTEPSNELWIHSEACLSIPKVSGDVARPLEITVTWLDLDGKEYTKTFHGWAARVIMHENDHINGVLYIDRIPPEQRKAIEPQLRLIKKKY
ncbi:MAG: def [Chlamydiia bacterium]|nr:def [Chlamydiia bacterium]